MSPSSPFDCYNARIGSVWIKESLWEWGGSNYPVCPWNYGQRKSFKVDICLFIEEPIDELQKISSPVPHTLIKYFILNPGCQRNLRNELNPFLGVDLHKNFIGEK